MPLLGSSEKAQRVRQIFEDAGGEAYLDLPRNTHDGWTLIGAGDHRVAYRAPSGEVYKVGRDRINRREHGVLQILAADPETVGFVPKYAFYDFASDLDRTGWSKGDTIVTMEHVEDDGTEADESDLERLIDCLVKLKVNDQEGAWRVRDGRPVIIDCGGH